MRTVVSSGRRFVQTPDGVVWTPSSDDYKFWQRYLTVFDEVCVVGRIQQTQDPPQNWKPANGQGVAVEGLPYYLGPVGYVKTYMNVQHRLRQIVRKDDAVILRIPNHVGTSVETIVRQRQQPYGAEVVGDTAAAMSRGSVDHALRPLLKLMYVRTVRRQCRNACAIAYVTEHALQRAYPPSPQAYATHYSSIELPDDCIAAAPRAFIDPKVRIVSVGSMAMKYKRFDVLSKAVEHCIVEGLDLKLTIIGDGCYRPFFEEKARGLGDRVEFLGELPGSAKVREQMAKADLFVLASANEGLPRVVIEAMALGLPCIGTTIGGTPELLPPEDMVPPGDIAALAVKIREFVSNKERMQAASERNLKVAQRYIESELAKRRYAMYSYLRDCTEAWVRRGQN